MCSKKTYRETSALYIELGKPLIIAWDKLVVLDAGALAFQFVSLKDAYTLRTAGDVSILRLNERYADTGQVAFIGYTATQGNGAPVGNPLVNLIQSAS